MINICKGNIIVLPLSYQKRTNNKYGKKKVSHRKKLLGNLVIQVLG